LIQEIFPELAEDEEFISAELNVLNTNEEQIDGDDNILDKQTELRQRRTLDESIKEQCENSKGSRQRSSLVYLFPLVFLFLVFVKIAQRV
jgi:hypothetical protein